MTNEKWDFLAHRWNDSTLNATLNVDGFKVELRRFYDGKASAVGIFVNGKIKSEPELQSKSGKYSEIATRFYARKQRQTLNEEQVKATRRVMGKKAAKRAQSVYKWATPFYDDFEDFKTQLIDNNKSIELVTF